MGHRLAGLGKKERNQLATLLKAGLAVITPKNAAEALQMAQSEAAQRLALWTKKGWLSRVKHGVYIPVPLQAETSAVMVDDPWILANALFGPCYIGGWSAAEYWGFTEQIFYSTMVFTTKKSKARELDLKGARFNVKTIKAERLFGCQNVWRDNHKVAISDPTRTIVDAFNDPAVVGGIRMASDVFDQYIKADHRDWDLLFRYSRRMKNTAIFKRMGFILEKFHPAESQIIEKIKREIKSGYSQLDPATPGESLVTAWNLWVPTAWKKGTGLRDQH